MYDRRGVPISSTNPASLSGYERALRAFNSYVGDPVALIDEVLAADPDFAMGHVLRACVDVSLWERSAVAEVQSSIASLERLHASCNERERRHARVLGQWVAGDWTGMRASLDRLNAEWPRDLLALQLGHLADFYAGDRDNLRGRIARALPAWSAADAEYGFLLGMHAFGLEECGAYGAAEDAGRHALEREPADSWAHHAVLHVMEMQTRQAEGMAFADSRRPHWTQPDNGFRFHNWWHEALFYLDTDNIWNVLELYDRGVRAERAGIQVMMLDAAALLWRLHLRGVDVGDRWDELVALYESDGEAGFYAFNDVHALMAFAATGRDPAIEARIAAMETAAAKDDDNAGMTRTVGLPIARALQAFSHECYADVVDLLWPVRYRAHAFGGSHAQRDVVHRTLIEAAMRAGERELAIALSNERTALRPHCPFGWQLRAAAGTIGVNADLKAEVSTGEAAGEPAGHAVGEGTGVGAGEKTPFSRPARFA